MLTSTPLRMPEQIAAGPMQLGAPQLPPQVYLPEVNTPLLDSAPPPSASMTVARTNLYLQLMGLTPETAQRRTRLGDSPLHRAAKNGIIQAVPGRLLTGTSFMEKNALGDTPLHIAARLGFLHQVPTVFFTDQTVTTWDASGETPLHIAARCGQFCRMPKRSLSPELLSLPTRNQAANTVLHLLAGANRLNLISNSLIWPETWSLLNGEGLTPCDELHRALETVKLKNSNESWRCDPATDKQEHKLKYFGCTWDEGITKGQASEAIDECARSYPELERSYYARPATKDQLEELRPYLGKGETPDDYAAPGEPLTYGRAKDLLEEFRLEERAREEERMFRRISREHRE